MGIMIGCFSFFCVFFSLVFWGCFFSLYIRLLKGKLYIKKASLERKIIGKEIKAFFSKQKLF